MDNLFEQMANISKAHGYDILREKVKELEEENRRLKQREEDLEHYVGYVQDATSRGAVPLDYEEWQEAGKPLTK